MLVSGCANIDFVKIDTFCATHQPRYYNDATINAMSDEEVKDAVRDEKYGVKHCGWPDKPRGKRSV